MDARFIRPALALLGLTLLTGCEIFAPRGATVTIEPPPQPDPTRQDVVADTGVSSSGGVATASEQDRLILDYIDSVDEAGRQPIMESAPSPLTTQYPPPDPGVQRRPRPVPEPENVAEPDERQTTVAPEIREPTPAAPAADPVAASEPPMLVGISVNGASRPLAVQPDGTRATPPAAAAERQLNEIETLLGQYLDANGDDSFRAQYDARMARLLVGDFEGARAPLQLVTAEQQQLASHLIEVQIAVREAHLGNWPDSATRALAELRPLLDTLSATSPLSIPTLALCTQVGGFGNYTALEPAEFRSGQPVAFATYCEIANAVAQPRGDGLVYTELAMTTTVLTRGGDLVLELEDESIVDTCRRKRSDFFVAREVRLPATLSPGGYVVNVTIADKLGQKVAASQATFRVVVR